MKRFVLLALIALTFGSTTEAITPEQAASLHHEQGQRFGYMPYIQPNEDKYYRFADANRSRKGTFIGVGTFRVLAGASYGDFDQVIFTDVDERVVEFNKMQIEVLTRSHTVSEFIAKLMDVADKYEQKSSFRYHYAHALQQFKSTDPGGSFLTDHAKFLHLRELARKGRMHSVPMSLTGHTGFRRLADLLANEGSKVGVVDVSNAPDYIHRERRDWIAFEENLVDLPWARNGIVNFTTEYAGNSSWNYTSVPEARYLDEMANVHESAAFGPFVKRLIARARSAQCASLF